MSTPTTYTVTEARKQWSWILLRASIAKERIQLTRHGKVVAVVVPAVDVETLEKHQ